MRKARRFISRQKQVFLVGFSLIFPRIPRISKNGLNTSLANEGNSAPLLVFSTGNTHPPVSILLEYLSLSSQSLRPTLKLEERVRSHCSLVIVRWLWTIPTLSNVLTFKYSTKEYLQSSNSNILQNQMNLRTTWIIQIIFKAR